ncbi:MULTISPECIES: hypothetical protein [Flagellimonas]|uniref:Glycine dehydrogenase n=2 Tax=Flagellimonas TaxID=444459 RepID=A0A3A1NKK9_9FLAO|nr:MULTISPECIES: hypothetical protein [Allomuricauda]RIV46772.1 hypothetical protein D2V05_02100 [Allomuricauda maritima]RIV71986.1 hypothetical protein D2U88_05900 [Allomuricauda aequoris]TXJ99657.1 hypothetical protein FQ017_02085 [Allomuricauda maritima]TXK03753.1 hypothetical protein FQ019_05855 [Allomuricauda aequoris]
MKITCQEASNICNKSQYKEASFWDIVKLRIHLLYCKACKQYSKKNSELTSMCDRAGLTMLSKDDKERMKRDLEKKF